MIQKQHNSYREKADIHRKTHKSKSLGSLRVFQTMLYDTVDSRMYLSPVDKIILYIGYKTASIVPNFDRKCFSLRFYPNSATNSISVSIKRCFVIQYTAIHTGLQYHWFPSSTSNLEQKRRPVVPNLFCWQSSQN